MARLTVLAATAFALLVVASATSAQQVYRTGDGVTMPVVVKNVKPDYTPDALAERIEGVVTLEAVVRADGSVGDVTVTESLDKEKGLDEQAVRAMTQWEFKSGRKDDMPVPVLITVKMSFRVR